MGSVEDALCPAPSRPVASGDPRVALVLEVLGGTPLATASARWSVDPALAERWVRAFVEGGTARATNHPVADEASQRDRFLAAVAHELRSPLTVARGWAALLEDDEGAVPPGTVARLQEALDRLAERIEEVELLVAASLGRVRLRMAAVRIGDLVASLPGAPETVGGVGPDAVLHADAGVYRRILADLWGAADSAPGARRRRIDLRRDGAWWVLSVRREGAPIDTRRLRALFEPFDHNDDDTGVTFGLYLARALTVALGGTLGVEQDDAATVLWLRTPAVALHHVSGPTPRTTDTWTGARPGDREDHR